MMLIILTWACPACVCSGQNLSNYNLCSIKLFGRWGHQGQAMSQTLHLIFCFFPRLKYCLLTFDEEVGVGVKRLTSQCAGCLNHHIITAICKHSGWCEHFAATEFWRGIFIRMIQRFSRTAQLSRAWRNVTVLKSSSALIHLMDVVKEWEFLIT